MTGFFPFLLNKTQIHKAKQYNSKKFTILRGHWLLDSKSKILILKTLKIRL